MFDAGSQGGSVVVTGVGMLTSLGQADQSFAASRARLKRFEEWDAYCAMGPDEQFDPPEPIQAAFAPIGYEGEALAARLVTIALPAMEEALRSAGLGRSALAKSRVAVGLSSTPASIPEAALGRTLIAGLRHEGALPADQEVQFHFKGHAAGAAAVEEAIGNLRSGACQIAIVGGVETFLDPQRLDFLDRNFRLKSSRAPDGYIPGEAAVFCVLEMREAALRRGARPLATLASVVLADEPAPQSPDEPPTATGLCDAVRRALEMAASQDGAARASGWVLSDFNGERRRAKEWALALTRLNSALGDDVTLWHPAESFGDVGAASVPLLVSIAATAYRRGVAPRPTALVLASSDPGPRCALLVTGSQGLS